MEKERVHNQLEAEVLIKQAYRHGDEEKYNGCQFFTHDGKFLFTCKTKLTEFEIDFSHNGEIKDSVIVFI